MSGDEIEGFQPDEDSLCDLLINGTLQSDSWVSNCGGSTTMHLYGRREDGSSIYVRNDYK